jgi:hypothetical protein
LEYGEALKIIGGLSNTSKMPAYSWSISAELCITGAKLQSIEGTVCHDCYALKGFYRMDNVKEAHTRRLAALDHPDFINAFVEVLSTTYGRMRKTLKDGSRENRFRWLDSGDLQSVTMLAQIDEIARRTPHINHWLPTREIQIVKQFLKERGEFASNLTVRVSSVSVGVKPKRSPLGLPFATVGIDHDISLNQCPALASQDGKCLDCNACWTSKNVNYPLH